MSEDLDQQLLKMMSSSIEDREYNLKARVRELLSNHKPLDLLHYQNRFDRHAVFEICTMRQVLVEHLKANYNHIPNNLQARHIRRHIQQMDHELHLIEDDEIPL